MNVRTFGRNVWLDDVKFQDTQVELGERFKHEPFQDFIKHFNMFWGFDVDNSEDVDELRILYAYVTGEDEL